jgi:hypothetical protein
LKRTSFGALATGTAIGDQAERDAVATKSFECLDRPWYRTDPLLSEPAILAGDPLGDWLVETSQVPEALALMVVLAARRSHFHRRFAPIRYWA